MLVKSRAFRKGIIRVNQTPDAKSAPLRLTFLMRHFVFDSRCWLVYIKYPLCATWEINLSNGYNDGQMSPQWFNIVAFLWMKSNSIISDIWLSLKRSLTISSQYFWTTSLLSILYKKNNMFFLFWDDFFFSKITLNFQYK